METIDNKKVIILDYQLGNLYSVKHACDYVGLNAIISSDKKELESADAMILPGVGAFGEAMDNLNKLDLIQPIYDFISSKKPFFGICLGLQLLFSESEEFGAKKGLDIVQGVIKKFPSHIASKKIKVPQISWNSIYKNRNEWESSPLKSLTEGDFMYFVHSFYAKPVNFCNILTMTNYEGIDYCSGISKENNIFAVQFHPEKSAEKGIAIYKNWGEINSLI